MSDGWTQPPDAAETGEDFWVHSPVSFEACGYEYVVTGLWTPEGGVEYQIDGPMIVPASVAATIPGIAADVVASFAPPPALVA